MIYHFTLPYRKMVSESKRLVVYSKQVSINYRMQRLKNLTISQVFYNFCTSFLKSFLQEHFFESH